MLALHGRHLKALGPSSEAPFVARLTNDPSLPVDERPKHALLLEADASDPPPGYRAYLSRQESMLALPDSYVLAKAMQYLEPEDVVRIEPRRGYVQALYRRNSLSNSLLVTERCDNYCLMCSQPPKPGDDPWILEELKKVVPLISPATSELGITGGEPTLLGPGLIYLVALMQEHLPATAVHLLSNGRSFANPAYARQLADLGHHDLIVGIPLYSAVPHEHDYVVQARGAFSETVRGILNLKKFGVRVEIRFVIHADTYRGLPAFARFVARNLVFVDHVALMGLELVGFAKANLDALWVDPLDYQAELAEACTVLDRSGVTVSVYNQQLCTLRPEVAAFARKSISDWKNDYFAECDGCARKDECAGFFSSSERRRSRGIRAFHLDEKEAV